MGRDIIIQNLRMKIFARLVYQILKQDHRESYQISGLWNYKAKVCDKAITGIEMLWIKCYLDTTPT